MLVASAQILEEPTLNEFGRYVMRSGRQRGQILWYSTVRELVVKSWIAKLCMDTNHSSAGNLDRPHSQQASCGVSGDSQ